MQDRIDDALEFYRDYHFDGTERTFLKHQVTQTDIDNEYISVLQLTFKASSICLQWHRSKRKQSIQLALSDYVE